MVVFDRSFYNAFHGADGKSAVEHMREAVSILKAAYKDRTLKKWLGVTINIIGTIAINRKRTIKNGYLRSKAYQNYLRNNWYGYVKESLDLSGRAVHHRYYDLTTLVSYPGAQGWAGDDPDDTGMGNVCNSNRKYRFQINFAYGPHQCNTFNPPERIECNPTNRISLTAQVLRVLAFENNLLLFTK